MKRQEELQRLGKVVTREELYEAVWSKTIKALVQEWNTNYLQVDEACKELQVPRPNQGYWQWIARGRPVKRKPLRKPTRKLHAEWVLLTRVESPAGAADTAAAVARAEPQRRQEAGSEVVRKQQETPGPAERKKEEAPAAPPVQAAAESEAELREGAERAVLDLIRQAGEMDFWPDRISKNFGPGELGPWLKLKHSIDVEESKLRRAVGGVRKEYGSFAVKVEEAKDETGRARVVVEVALREGAEWKDAWEEAWTFAEHPNPHWLSDNALRLYEWAKGAKNTGALTERRVIGSQARLVKTYGDMEDHLREIRQRADPTIQWETVGGVWHTQFRIWFETVADRFYDYGPLNPALGLDMRRGGLAELGRFRAWLYEEIVKPGFPEGTETVGIFDIRSRRELRAVFGRLPADCGKYGPLPDFFDSVRLMDGLKLRRTFNSGAGPWLVVCQLQTDMTWGQVKARLAAKAGEIPLEQRYTLSVDSRALLRWILDLRKEEYLLGMTPEVEDRLRGDVGIETDLGGGNARAYLELLVDEINEKTEFQLRIIPWRHCAREGTRILVKKKGTGLDEIVRAVQGLALAENKVLGADKVRERILGLIHEG